MSFTIDIFSDNVVFSFAWIKGTIYILWKEKGQGIKGGFFHLLTWFIFARVHSGMQNTDHSGRDCPNTVMHYEHLLSH